MGKLIIPENYSPIIDYMESQRAIKKIKDFFQAELAYGLNLRRVSAPLFVTPESGLNDNLSGVERTVRFEVKDMDGQRVRVSCPVSGQTTQTVVLAPSARASPSIRSVRMLWLWSLLSVGT